MRLATRWSLPRLLLLLVLLSLGLTVWYFYGPDLPWQAPLAPQRQATSPATGEKTVASNTSNRNRTEKNRAPGTRPAAVHRPKPAFDKYHPDERAAVETLWALGATIPVPKDEGRAKTVYLGRTKIEDDQLAALEDLVDLEELDLSFSPITDDGLQHVAQLKRLNTLYLVGTHLEGPGLEHLKELKDLVALHLSRTDVDDEALNHLEHHKQLTDLWLAQTKITDVGLAQVGQLTNLVYLDLAFTEISDAGLTQLHSLSQLNTIVLDDTAVTDEGVSELHNALPKIQRVLR